MPLYTFKCGTCDHTQDYLVKMGTEKTDCKKCGQEATKQLSYKFAATGLPNGHIAIKGHVRKTT